VARAEEIRQFGEGIGANKLANRAGITLLQEVSHFYKDEFPIYAYTSKGPYLLDSIGFDHIGASGAQWLRLCSRLGACMAANRVRACNGKILD